jgi:hypothetical protein
MISGAVQDAPQEVTDMLMDLKLTSRILNKLVNRKDPRPHVKDALEHCDAKVEVKPLRSVLICKRVANIKKVLLSIMREFEPNFSFHSGGSACGKLSRRRREKSRN